MGTCTTRNPTASSCSSNVNIDVKSAAKETTSDCSMASIDSAKNEDTGSSRTRAKRRPLGSPGTQRQTRAHGRKLRGNSTRSLILKTLGIPNPTGPVLTRDDIEKSEGTLTPLRKRPSDRSSQSFKTPLRPMEKTTHPNGRAHARVPTVQTNSHSRLWCHVIS